MSTLADFVAAFKHEHRFNGPSFWDPSLLFCFLDIYASDLPTYTNPIRDLAWHSVTEEEIDRVCGDCSSLAIFLKNHVGAKPLFRQMALDPRDVRARTLPALIVVDPQNDFVKSDGALAVPGAKDAIPAINALLDRTWAKTYVTADWHPMNHCSFAVNNPGTVVGESFVLPNGVEQIAWPVHCVQPLTDYVYREGGAAFHKEILLEKPACNVPHTLMPPPGGAFALSPPPPPYIPPRTYTAIYKGRDATKEAYSGFAGSCEKGKSLGNYLLDAGTTTVVICGFAIDYCVAATAIDARVIYGLRTIVVLSACRGVKKGTTDAAIQNMLDLGVEVIQQF